ncbi:MAG: DUF2914 domain-containing protein [Patescibacteria group bacterium]|nr:DUF2914 domain-containing protein [Patescibacteria group bacterium]
MAAGFIADNLLFKRIDLLQTQAVFASYAAVCFLTIPLLHWIEARAAVGIARPRWRSFLPIATQFALGGFWSGFFVFYGRAAVLSTSWPFLLLITVLLIGNEVLRLYHDRVVFTTILFFFALYSYMIFAVPIYTGSIGTKTFLESGLLAVVLFALFTVLLRVLGGGRFLADVRRIRVGAFLVLVVINVFYFTDILPPLPLSAQAVGIYHAVWRVPGAYFSEAEIEPWQVQYLGFEPTLHIVPGESLYIYSSIFAPTALTTTIVHRWQWYDPMTSEWTTRATIMYPIVGGRDGGYRGYSAVPIGAAGRWRVDVETASGRIIARVPFTVVEQSTPPPLETVTLE